MKIIVLADAGGRKELLAPGTKEGTEIVFVDQPEEFSNHPDADAFMDLLFEDHLEKMPLLKKLLPLTVIISSITTTLYESCTEFVRINGWPGFLRSGMMEAAASMNARENAANVFSALNRNTEWVDDQPGFITARIVSMIINEAFLSLQEQVSSREAIDTAMKLGTNYPYGPFEWAEMIGPSRIASLLKKLSFSEKRYQPASLLLS